MEKKTKSVKVTFFVTGQADKSKPVETPSLFKHVWNTHFLPQVLSKKQDPTFERKGVFDTGNKDLVLWIDSFESRADEPYYFGYVGVLRDTTLPTIYNRKTEIDSNIILSESDEILEKSYFLYYPTLDLLVFNQNHIGPRADDLAFMLYKLSGMSLMSFEPIWRNQELKSMLEDGSTLKRATLTIALPRSFKEANLNLSNNWSADMIKMMSASGMNRLTLQFWGRASTRKSEKGYIRDVVKEGFLELIKKCSGNSTRKDSPMLKKAEIQLKDSKPENLLSQELNTKVNVTVVGGYPTPSDMTQALIVAKIRCQDELRPYLIPDKASA
ncbi:MAG: hypothetical protein ACRDD9_21930 [Shewanella sp.]